MDGFKRPNKSRPAQNRPASVAQPNAPKKTAPPSTPPADVPSSIELPKLEGFAVAPPEKKMKVRSRLKATVFGIVGVILLSLLATYAYLLRPLDPATSKFVKVEIVSGMLPAQIAQKLEDSGVIRSSAAFRIHTRVLRVQNKLQAGNYVLSPADSTPEIVSLLQRGPGTSEIEVMFKPGATLADNKKVLLELGYSGNEIDQAFAARYDHPLFEGKPTSSDLEGYIFGETHRFTKGTTVEKILERFFDDYYNVIKENGLAEAYKGQGLSLYEGVTLASIIQRESGGDDKAGIAQVFLLRLSIGMQLGSDVTYQYIADKEGKPRDINYDSPYNTRRYTGLPPGPIASPGVEALKSVANPADGEYLYFLSGDDNKTYFARTFEEHEANIRNHCQEKCTII